MERWIEKAIRYATFGAIIIALLHLWRVPGRMDALDGRMNALESKVENMNLRLARIEGALFGIAPVAPDSAAAPGRPVSLAP